MKWGNHPMKNSVHRSTCLALYRALLRQCSKLPSDNVRVRSIVRENFDKYRSLNSPSRTIYSIQAGYEALDTMHLASQGDTNSIYRIKNLLERIKTREARIRPQQVPVTKSSSPKERKRAENIAFQEQTIIRHPNAEPILSRPRPVVNGRRKVPFLINARGIPFLRIKKPQPQNLSRVLRQKHEYKDKLIDRIKSLEVDQLFAKDEENWDRIIAGRNQIPKPGDVSWIHGSWAQRVFEARRKYQTDNTNFQKKLRDLAESMWNIVLAERKLAKEEESKRNKRELQP